MQVFGCNSADKSSLHPQLAKLLPKFLQRRPKRPLRLNRLAVERQLLRQLHGSVWPDAKAILQQRGDETQVHAQEWHVLGVGCRVLAGNAAAAAATDSAGRLFKVAWPQACLLGIGRDLACKQANNVRKTIGAGA